MVLSRLTAAVSAFAVLSVLSSVSMAQDYIPMRDRVREAPVPIRLPVSNAIPVSFFTGQWGQVSFNEEGDIPKMRGVARQYCGSLAVSITQRSAETFNMYVTKDLKEVQVYEQNGSLFVAPAEQLSDGVIRGARELHVIDNNAFTLRYIEADAHQHYGPNLFVRCGSRDPSPADSAPVKKRRKKKS